MTIGSGNYRIQNAKSGTYFDNSTKKAGIIHGWDSRPDSKGQKWRVEKLSDGWKLKNAGSGDYAHASGSKNGTDVKACDDASKWDIREAEEDGSFYIYLKGTNGVIDLDMGKKENGTQINIWEHTGAKQQKWKFHCYD